MDPKRNFWILSQLMNFDQLISSFYGLFDLGALHSFISTTFIREHVMLCEPIKTKLYVETIVGGILCIDTIFKLCRVGIGDSVACRTSSTRHAGF